MCVGLYSLVLFVEIELCEIELPTHESAKVGSYEKRKGKRCMVRVKYEHLVVKIWTEYFEVKYNNEELSFRCIVSLLGVFMNGINT